MPDASAAMASASRILHVAATSSPYVNGYTMRLASILEAQRAAGLHVEVVTSPFYPGRVPREAKVEIDGVAHHRCVHPAESVGAGGLLAWLHQLRARRGVVGAAATVVEEELLMRRLRRRIVDVARRMEADLIHVHTPYRCACPALAAGKYLRLPVVYEVRGNWEDTAVSDGLLREGGLGYRYIRWRESRAMRRAGAVVALCEQLARDVERRGVPSGRVFVAPNGADLGRLERASGQAQSAAEDMRGRLPAGLVVGYVGSLRPLEGVGELVEAVASMRAAGRAVVGVVVGDGPSLPALREQARRLGVADAVAFPGRVPPADVGAYYDLIDVFVVSRGSSRVTDLVTPIKPLEAMGRGKAVVMSNLPALRELGEPGDAARFYAAGSVSDLVAVAARLLDDRAALFELGARARAWVAHERTWSRSLDATLVAYDAAAQHAASR